MDRRSCVAAVGAVTVSTLAGCLDDVTDRTDDEDDDQPGAGSANGANQNDDVDPHGAVEAVETYIEAGQAGDEETMSDLAYDDSPVDPTWIERMVDESDDDWEIQETEPASFENVDVELLETDVELAEVEHVEALEFWLEDEALELIDGDDTALVRTEWTDTDPDGYGYPDEVDEESHWVLFVDDGEWTILWTGPPQGTIDDFREPVTDEEGRLVEAIEYDVQELDEDGEMAAFIDGDEIHTAEVTFVDDPDPDIDAARLESTIALGSGGVEPIGAAARFSVDLDPEGDELTVYAIVDGEEEVVHREHYEP
ncbi:hypothetical protein [Halovivax gelatinilyticus]|uniref:hypothetical protein n=1 Tax=Halovivax gelatinilyticus TaxID=2961597 RepID=UPI0020CA326D|nr:hypothetical protein [Halovivax gelatinilyticus]